MPRTESGHDVAGPAVAPVEIGRNRRQDRSGRSGRRRCEDRPADGRRDVGAVSGGSAEPEAGRADLSDLCAVLARLTAPLALYGDRGEPLFLNPAMARLLSAVLTSADGPSSPEVDGDRLGVAGALAAVVDGRATTVVLQRQLRRRAGRTVDLVVQVTRVEVGRGHCVVVQAEDVTGSRRAEVLAAEREAIPSALVTVDEAGRIVDWSSGAERLLGWPAEAVLGQDVAVIVSGPDRAAHRAGLAAVLAGERPPRPTALSVTALRMDGSEVPVEMVFGRTAGRAPRVTASLRERSSGLVADRPSPFEGEPAGGEPTEGESDGGPVAPGHDGRAVPREGPGLASVDRIAPAEAEAPRPWAGPDSSPAEGRGRPPRLGTARGPAVARSSEQPSDHQASNRQPSNRQPSEEFSDLPSDEGAERRARWRSSSALRRLTGLFRGEPTPEDLVLLFQPEFELASGRMCALEGLARWLAGDARLLQPTEVLPIATDAGLARRLLAGVLPRALRAACRWRAAGFDDVAVVVNLSKEEIEQPELTLSVQRLLRETGLPASSLMFDLDAGWLSSASPSSLRAIGVLAESGARVAVDRVGEAAVDLARLGCLAPSEFKIARTLWSGLDRDGPGGQAERVLRAVVDLGHALGALVVAEGVESAQELDFVRALGADRAQGVLFSPPLPEEALAAFLARTPLRSSGEGGSPTGPQ